MLKPENFLFHTTSKQKKEEEVVLNLEQLERQAIEKALRISKHLPCCRIFRNYPFCIISQT